MIILKESVGGGSCRRSSRRPVHGRGIIHRFRAEQIASVEMRVMRMTGMMMRRTSGSRTSRLIDHVVHHDVVADVSLDRVSPFVVRMVLLLVVVMRVNGSRMWMMITAHARIGSIAASVLHLRRKSAAEIRSVISQTRRIWISRAIQRL